ncbi:MAG: PKD domain-containing protein, partial [Pseudomonadales bacterium]|nr:PKD domain-containing protein [Pseudomonadales bacterium]
MTAIRRAAALASALLLAACGGGSGGAGAGADDANRRPTARFEASPESGAAPLQVRFDAAASSDPDGDIASYRWDFGDGATGAGRTVAHTFTDAGTFTTRLTVTDAVGSSASASRTITVNALPVARASADRLLGPAPLDVGFDGSASTDADGEIVDYAWSFGDGTSASGATVTHRYTDSARFDAVLTVTDDLGGTASTTIEVRTVFEAGGTIAIQSSSVADSDVNDRFTTPRPNDDFATAQAVPNPATIGGYVTAPGAGPEGALQDTGDTRDVYRFEAAGGETILLGIAEAGEDLDLFLFAGDGSGPVDQSIGVTETEIVRVPDGAPGTYFVAVDTFADDASSYVLTIGQLPLAAAQHGARWTPEREIVPGEVVVGPSVTRDDGVRTASAASVPVKRLAVSTRERVLQIDEGYRSRWREVAANAASTATAARMRTLSAVKDLAASGAYAWVEPNWIRRAQAVPDDPFLPSQWHYEAISLTQAWDVGQGDPGVVVAVVDTGILPAHPEFEGQLVPGYDFVDDDADPTDPGSSAFGGASSFHGTHVAGTVAARTDNGSGIAGVGWNTRVMPVRVLDGDGSGRSSDVREGIRFAAGLPNASGTLPAIPADVINLSLGGGGPSAADQAVIDEVRARGVIVVAAAGNERSS